jgi:hypothetical protein
LGTIRNSAIAIIAMTIANFISFMIAFPFADASPQLEPQNTLPTTCWLGEAHENELIADIFHSKTLPGL